MEQVTGQVTINFLGMEWLLESAPSSPTPAMAVPSEADWDAFLSDLLAA